MIKTLVITSGNNVTLPADFNKADNIIEAIGGGGSAVVCGGGGAAWAMIRNFQGNPGDVIPISISPGAAANSNADAAPTWFNSATTLKAAGGHSATFVSGAKNVLGGQASDCVGDICYSGGNSGINNDFTGSSHSGGGGAANQYGNGGDGGNALYTDGTFTAGDGHGGSSPLAGAGGAAAASGSNGNNGVSDPSGGGGGSTSNAANKGGDGGFPGGGGAGGDTAAGSGAAGQIRITWSVAGTGMSGSTQAAPAVFDLTTSSTDWVEFPNDWSLVNRKNGGGNLFSMASTVAGAVQGSYSNSLNFVSWTDGLPTPSSINDARGIYAWGQSFTATAGQGLHFTVAADTTLRKLEVLWGSYSGSGILIATLSDGTSVPFTQSPVGAADANAKDYVTTVEYKAGSAGQTLDVTIVLTTVGLKGYSNITLRGAKLSPVILAPVKLRRIFTIHTA